MRRRSSSAPVDFVGQPRRCRALRCCNYATTTDEDIVLSEVFGGPHGYAFSDMSSITLGQTLSSVTVRGGERIDAISAQASKPGGSNWDHGGSGGKEQVLTLGSAWLE
ncbi:hypothetical protein PF008_g27683 [Phytophthora fragariae]|uniref:Jacalin-type lectin domain-containing protein n=1 Tax=Phytophthora fragariae TaxID=53985 RepID=A0A6G0QDL6_9STRA|nr:hypothetical protein PF008_g27683 [Phytophthora fragariae]